jgi:hypothetical protein
LFAFAADPIAVSLSSNRYHVRLDPGIDDESKRQVKSPLLSFALHRLILRLANVGCFLPYPRWVDADQGGIWPEMLHCSGHDQTPFI